MKISISDKEYTFKFGYGAYRKICELYGFTKVSGFQDLIKRFKLDKMTDPTFEQMDCIGNLVLVGIGSPEGVTTDDVVDVFFRDLTLLELLTGEISRSLPQSPDTSGKLTAGRKQ